MPNKRLDPSAPLIEEVEDQYPEIMNSDNASKPYQNWFCEEQNEIRCKEKVYCDVYIINTYKRTTHCMLELVTIQKISAFAELNAPKANT